MITMFVYLVIATALLVANDVGAGKLRIKGGSTTSIETYPFTVSIGVGNHHSCGGSLITKDIVLTAAHCVPSEEYLNQITIIAGSSLKRTGGVERRLTHYITHEGYRMTFDNSPINDIALFKVDRPFEMSNNIATISMFNAGEPVAPGSRATAIGWGQVPEAEKRLSPYGDRQIRSAVLSVVDKDQCARLVRERMNLHLKTGEMCAYAVNKDVCPGDSGGPLVVNGRLAGLVSWGAPCNDANPPPGVYTEISHFRNWIQDKVNALNNAGNDVEQEHNPNPGNNGPEFNPWGSEPEYNPWNDGVFW